MALNRTYSYQAFADRGLSFKDRSPSEFNNSEIVGSGFYQRHVLGEPWEMKEIFPAGMTGVEFVDCNLDNIYVPPGNTITRGTNKRMAMQNDGMVWIVDAAGKPIEPRKKLKFEQARISIDPTDIPSTPMTFQQVHNFKKILRARMRIRAVLTNINPSDTLAMDFHDSQKLVEIQGLEDRLAVLRGD